MNIDIKYMDGFINVTFCHVYELHINYMQTTDTFHTSLPFT